jgi:hypothetical protein
MGKYTICFEIYGKKLKTTVIATTEEEAKEIIKSKIVFHKITKEKYDYYQDIPDVLKDLFGGIKL